MAGNIKFDPSGSTMSETKKLRFTTAYTYGTIRTAPGVPMMFQRHPQHLQMVVKSISCTPIDAYNWEITTDYEIPNYSVPDFPETGGLKPWQFPPEIEVVPLPDEKRVEDRYYKDEDAKYEPSGLIQLPTGKPFDDPPMIPIKARQITINWNAQHANDADFESCEYTTNLLDVTINGRLYPFGTLYMQMCYFNPARDDDGTLYYKCTAQMFYRPDGHKFRPLYCDWEAVFDGKVLPVWKIKSTGGWARPPEEPQEGDEKVTEKVLLAEDGTLLTSLPSNVAAATPFFGDFRVYYQEDWSVLDMPTSIGRVKRR